MSIEQAYNSWAAQYDTNDNKTRDLDGRCTIETLSNYPFKSVLELGCGTGKNTAWLLGKADRVLGLDFSEEMLSTAKRKITNTNVTFKRADLTKAWEVEDQMADLVTSSLTLEHIADLNHIFREANKKLVPNGLFFISELHPFKQYQGSGAKFELADETVRLKTYTHHLTDYIHNAKANGFDLLELKEWFDDQKPEAVPRLISFVFSKNKPPQS